MSDHSERMDQAIRQASESIRGNLLALAKEYFPNLSKSGYLKVCPYCGDKGNTFQIRKTQAGHWTWGCHKPRCNASFENLKSERMADVIGFIAKQENKSRDEAIDIFLARAGVHNPRHDLPPKDETPKKRKKAAPKKQAIPAAAPQEEPPPPAAEQLSEEEPIILNPEPEEAPEPRRTPALFEPGEEPEEIPFSLSQPEPEAESAPTVPLFIPTVWDRLFELLVLEPSDREQLKRKRGFSAETIEAAGYRSSCRENRARLAPLLEEFPLGLLLSEGIATKDRETGEIKINSQLCGYGLVSRATKDHAEKWDWTNPILIPYRGRLGEILSIRPHKGGLSGKVFMRENGFELAFRSAQTRTHLYTTFLFWDRPEKWRNRIVLTEGEHKANALAQCGIPACAVPGIQMPRNEIFFEELCTILRNAGIREVIVCYDNEDKSHKSSPWDRYDVDVYALYTCHALRGSGFLPSHCVLPDEWRIDGKADWDGALQQFGKDASRKFNEALKKARPYYPQTELFSTRERDRVIQCKFNRLIHKPQILVGGDEEEELAKLILKAPIEWKYRLGLKDLATTLFNCRGCYYIHNKPTKEALNGTGRGKNHEPGLYEFKQEIEADLKDAPLEDLETIAELQAALAAVKFLIKGRIEIISDFTITCEFQVRTQSGEVHRLFRFKNKHGQFSDNVQVPPSACATSSKFREYCMGVGNYNCTMGDKHLQFLMQDLGTFSAWREIRELQMLGRDPDSGLWIFGDGAFTPTADLYEPASQEKFDVIFADEDGIIWFDGIGYRTDPRSLAQFVHKEPPKFFQRLGETPQEVYNSIKANPQKEAIEVAQIFLQWSADMIATFGDAAGLLIIGACLGYSISPELLAKYHGQPGIWLHGRGGAGKSETVRALMMSWGFDAGYVSFMLTGGTTAVAIERALSQYCDIPFHADEFRQDEVDKNRTSTLRSAFGRQSKAKGIMDGSNKTRSAQPMTSPIVSGEGVTSDSATLSRYVEAILAADKRLGSQDEQRQRFDDIQLRLPQLHRITRYILLNRKKFAKTCMQNLDEWMRTDEVMKSIHVDRLRISYGTAWAVFHTMMEYFSQTLATARAEGTFEKLSISPPDIAILSSATSDFKTFAINYAKNAAVDVISINFVVKFWSEVVTYSNLSHSAVKHHIWFEWCKIDPETNKAVRTTAVRDTEGLVRCIILQPKELYAEYEKEKRSRGQEPELKLGNIRAELQNERYWLKAPTNQKRQAHRMSFGEKGQIDVWILRFDCMQPAVQAVFAEKFEMKDEEDEDDLPLGI